MNMSFEQRRRMEGLLFVLPGIIVVLAVLGYPLIYNIVLSLKNMNVRNIASGSDFIGLKNYIDQFQSPLFRKICLLKQSRNLLLLTPNGFPIIPELLFTSVRSSLQPTHI